MLLGGVAVGLLDGHVAPLDALVLLEGPLLLDPAPVQRRDYVRVQRRTPRGSLLLLLRDQHLLLATNVGVLTLAKLLLRLWLRGLGLGLGLRMVRLLVLGRGSYARPDQDSLNAVAVRELILFTVGAGRRRAVLSGRRAAGLELLLLLY